MEFLAPDFFGGGISFTLWCWGLASDSSLAFGNLSEILSLRYAIEMTGDQDAFSAAFPARASSLSFPEIPAWPFTHVICADRPSTRIIRATYLLDLLDASLAWAGIRVACPGNCTGGIRMDHHVPLVAAGRLVPVQRSLDNLHLCIVGGLSASQRLNSLCDSRSRTSLVLRDHPA
jgi:hypothetical protein